MAFVALFDANVLYPGSLRDLVVRLGQTGLFRARWTDQILDEAFGAIVRNQPELAGRLVRTRELMKDAIDDVVVRGYEPLISGLSLPDPDDRHVLAAAIMWGGWPSPGAYWRYRSVPPTSVGSPITSVIRRSSSTVSG